MDINKICILIYSILMSINVFKDTTLDGQFVFGGRRQEKGASKCSSPLAAKPVSCRWKLNRNLFERFY